MCVKKRTDMAIISGRLWVWPIVMIVKIYGSCKKNIDNFVFIAISFKRLNEIT